MIEFKLVFVSVFPRFLRIFPNMPPLTGLGCFMDDELQICRAYGASGEALMRKELEAPCR